MGQGPPKVMKNGSCSATTAAGSAALPFVISTGGVMGQRPTQGDEKRVLFSNYCCWKRRPPLCHLDRRSYGPRPTQGDEKRVLFSNDRRWKRRPPLCHLDRRSYGPRPTQGDEKRVLFSNDCRWKRRPPLCHLDRRSYGPKAHPR